MGGLVLLLVAVTYGAFSRRLDRLWISAPMVFVAAGLAIGPDGADLLHLEGGSHVVLSFTELTLAALLFTDATTVPLRAVKGDAGVPGRLLSVGLLLTMVLGAVTAMLVVPGVSWAEAALIAVVLAPTDAALGMAVVTDKAVPVRIRRALNIESGLNDGIATPFVTVFLAVVVGETASQGGSPVLDAFVQIAIAIGVAVVVGAAGGRLLAWGTQRAWSSHTSRQLFVLALAFVAYVGAVELGGNGFVAAFVAGLVFGAVDEGNRAAVTFTEDVALIASLLVWVIFGAYFAGPVLTGGLNLPAVAYALLSLTLIRLLPVSIALMGKGFRPLTTGFMGWFGPRGLASVVFTLIAVEDLRGTGIETPLFEVATWTILLSVFLHGLTARPLSAAYGARMQSAGDDLPELGFPDPACGVTSSGRPSGAYGLHDHGADGTTKRTPLQRWTPASRYCRHSPTFVAALRPRGGHRAGSDPRAAGDGVRRARRRPGGERPVHDDRLSGRLRGLRPLQDPGAGPDSSVAPLIFAAIARCW